MMSNPTIKTEGKLQASGTSVSGFSTTNVFANRSVSDKGYTFAGTDIKGARLVFFTRTLDIKEGRSLEIKSSYEEGTVYAAYVDEHGKVYEGKSGKINFEVFDGAAGKAQIFSKLVMSNDSETKQVEARGEFSGIQENNKKVLDEARVFKLK
jgi:hypothetical protein